MARRKWILLIVLIPVHIAVTRFTWADIRDRPADQIRGSKRLWRILSAVQMGNSLAYFVIGRKRAIVNEATG